MEHFLPVAASTFAGPMDRLMTLIMVITGVWFIAAEAVLFYLIFKYRRRPGRPASYVAGSTRGQMAWVLLPCVAILGFDFWIEGASAPVWDMIKLHRPPHEMVVRIDGRQWAWETTNPGPDGKLDTPDDITATNELHVPVNEVVQFELRSKDVLHSLWIPELRLKQDIVPGRTILGWFEATRPGQYGILCAQLCGVAHGLMHGTLYVDTPEGYRQYLASQAKNGGTPTP